MREAARRVMRIVTVSLTVAVFLYSGQIACWSTEENRYFIHWKPTDGVAIVLGIAVLATVGALAAILLDVFGTAGLRRVGQFLFLLAVLAGVTSFCQVEFIGEEVSSRHDWLSILCWTVAVVVLLRWRERLTKLATNTCLIFSPLVIILCYQVLTWKSWPDVKGARAEAGTPEQSADNPAFHGGPVFVFIFDQWSYNRSVDDHGFLPALKNTRQLSRQSVVFSHALSPFNTSYISIPRLIYQEAGYVRPRRGRVRWLYRGKYRPSEEVPSLFTEARQCGYETALIGFYHVYAVLLGDQVGYSRSYPQYWIGSAETLPSRTLALAVCNLRSYTDPLCRVAWRKIYTRIHSMYWIDLTDRLNAEAKELIRSCPENTFALVHLTLPHGPFIFNADGTFRGPFRENQCFGTGEEYFQQLCYADRVLGQLMDELKQSGKFNQSTIVVTSDHTWQWDPDPELLASSEGHLHVPLIIKLPGQQSGSVIDGRLEMVRLKPFFQAVFRGEGDPETLTALLRSVAASPGEKASNDAEAP